MLRPLASAATRARAMRSAASAREDRPISASRLLVKQRRTLRSSLSAGTLLLAGLAPLIGAAIAILYPHDAGLTALVYGALAVLALAVGQYVRRRRARRPELAGFVLATGVVGAAALLMAIAPDTHTVTATTFTIVPVGVAVFIPWSLRTHVGWLGLSAAMLAVAVAAPSGIGFSDEHWRDFAMGFAMSAVVSIVALRLIGRLRLGAYESERRAAVLAVRTQVQRAQLAELNRLLEVTVRTDPLTGVGNRLRLEEDLGVLHARLARHGRGFGLVMVDLDRFKGFNDLYGHVVGDEALRAVAKCLGQRSSDSVYRFGGEEFVAFLPEADNAAAMAAAERMLRAVTALGIPHGSNPPWGVVSASAGVTVVDRGDTGTTYDWLQAADAALYRAKENGRNQALSSRATG